MTATPDPWQVITDVMSELLRGGQTADIRCRAAVGVLMRNGISFGKPLPAAQVARPAPEVADLRLAAVRSILLDDTMSAEDARSQAAAAAYDGSPRQPRPAPELATLLADWRKTADSLKHRGGVGNARERNTLEVVIGQVEAILTRPTEPAPELAEPVTVAGVPYSDYPSLVAAMQAEIDRERTARLHMAGERDEVRSDVARVRRAILASGKTHQWKIQQLLAIVGEIPAGEPEQPAPELADAVAKSDRYREALENVFAVLDRNILTYAERISYARTLIRTAREGK